MTGKEGKGEGSGRSNTLHPPVVYGQNKISLACPYFDKDSLIRQVASPLSLKMNCAHRDVTSVSFGMGAK